MAIIIGIIIVICVSYIIFNSKYRNLVTLLTIFLYFLVWKSYVTIDKNDKLLEIELDIKINTIEIIKQKYPILTEDIIQVKTPTGYVTVIMKDYLGLYKLICYKKEKGTLL